MAATKKQYSSDYTLAIARMEIHYMTVGLLGPTNWEMPGKQSFYAPGWSNKRVDRLCELRNCTIEELGMFFLIPPVTMLACYRKNKWPSTYALHFQMHESYIMSQLLGVSANDLPRDVFCVNPGRRCYRCGRTIPKRRKMPDCSDLWN